MDSVADWCDRNINNHSDYDTSVTDIVNESCMDHINSTFDCINHKKEKIIERGRVHALSLFYPHFSQKIHLL